jgi:NAD(P)H-flavin reductase
LLLANGTGWAPMKALIEQAAAEGSRRRVDVYVGARSRTEFYDSDAIDKLGASYPWLRVTYVVGSETDQPGEFTQVVDRALADADWRSRHVYICGSDPMVTGAVTALTRLGYHGAQLHYEMLSKHWYGPSWRIGGDPQGHASAGEA